MYFSRKTILFSQRSQDPDRESFIQECPCQVSYWPAQLTKKIWLLMTQNFEIIASNRKCCKNIGLTLKGWLAIAKGRHKKKLVKYMKFS